MGDASKLPKWAQRELSNLGREVDDLRAQLLVKHTTEKTRVSFSSDGMQTMIPVPEHSTVRFNFGDDDRAWGMFIDVSINVHRPDEVSISGGDLVEVLPHSGNVVGVRVRGERRRPRPKTEPQS
jgi:hypothetical protein